MHHRQLNHRTVLTQDFQFSEFRAYHRPTVSYQLCTTPYSVVAFAESRASLGNGIYSAGRQD
jgi:hypothetical protein